MDGTSFCGSLRSMYEPRTQPLISPRHFVRRIGWHVGASLGVVGVSLFLGMAGFHLTEGLGWLDGFLQSAMLLGGMGPTSTLTTEAGKLFAGLYALYCGLVFIVVAGLIIAPVIHRILHRLHWDDPPA
jgi:hypothetical protein